MRRVPLALVLAFAAFLALTGSAQAVVLYDQMTPLQEPPSSFSSDVYAVPTIDDFTQQLSDDFTVPAGQSWTISQVDVAGRYFGSGTSTTNVNVSLLATDPGDPDLPVDPPLFQQLGTATSGAPNYVIPLTGAPALGPGHYWVSVQALGASFDANQQQSNSWSWRVLDIQANGIGSQPAVKMQDPSDPLRCPTWRTLVACVDTGTRNLAFRLHGPDAPPPTAGVSKKKKCKKGRKRKGGKCVKKSRAKKVDPGFTG
jgi:hypothetical protein